ncbi:hypothetical protein JOB18_029394 [Solea senegalensis]|uniref:C3H1-type domain-containing protein n=1 Tax=Solea senegalensis TaxID=28829 RepID=A0AAV6SH92_SOLSE|nr:hypothetical protein JOB18_029394 [Solea senegalensis]
MPCMFKLIQVGCYDESYPIRICCHIDLCRVSCSFGACRHRDLCSRLHTKPTFDQVPSVTWRCRRTMMTFFESQ